MISVNDFKTGVTIEVDGNIWKVMEFQHVKPGKGAAFVRSKLRNMRTGAVNDKTFRAGEKVAKAQINNQKMSYLYSTGDAYVLTQCYDSPREHENDYLYLSKIENIDEYNGSFDVKIGNVIEKLKEVEKEDLTNE